ncbi:hypothetical protein JTE90_026194 [Oedothorax gibbosus]|uniref:Speckle-type POZ protein n=1 Tax=Oedothorax gibbosus TaxID=931172 RepID=A0AAV6TZW4_9ARAC|nr:hypothetical protein JTE90_026194 [Oedothorax gibbosus]
MAHSNGRLHTSNPKSDYTFSWTIENFHMTTSLKVQGAEFLPIPDDKYESLVSLYPVAKKYQVKSLQKSLFVLLSTNLSVDYVCEALVLADLHGDKELKEIAKIFARENFVDLAGTVKWVELVTTYPKISREVLDFMKPTSK